jgi:hypothetical protein
VRSGAKRCEAQLPCRAVQIDSVARQAAAAAPDGLNYSEGSAQLRPANAAPHPLITSKTLCCALHARNPRPFTAQAQAQCARLYMLRTRTTPPPSAALVNSMCQTLQALRTWSILLATGAGYLVMHGRCVYACVLHVHAPAHIIHNVCAQSICSTCFFACSKPVYAHRLPRLCPVMTRTHLCGSMQATAPSAGSHNTTPHLIRDVQGAALPPAERGTLRARPRPQCPPLNPPPPNAPLPRAAHLQLTPPGATAHLFRDAQGLLCQLSSEDTARTSAPSIYAHATRISMREYSAGFTPDSAQPPTPAQHHTQAWQRSETRDTISY